MEPIDYNIVDKGKFREGFGWEYAASTYFFSYIIAYDASKFGDKVPTGMADFFDVEKFPGKRSLYKWGAGMWEAALLADGVAPEKLYPLDLKRAHDKIAAFKDNVVSYWGGGAESQSVLLNGEASMALIWSTRASLIEKDSGGSIKFIWDQGLISPGAMGVLKGNPGGKDNAMKFSASAQDPKKQLVMFEMLGQGPANPAADALVRLESSRIAWAVTPLAKASCASSSGMRTRDAKVLQMSSSISPARSPRVGLVVQHQSSSWASRWCATSWRSVKWSRALWKGRYRTVAVSAS